MSTFLWIIGGILLLAGFSIIAATAQAAHIRHHATRSPRECDHQRLTGNTSQCLDCGYIFH